MLATAGGILFYGDPSGYFIAADERDGRTLWRVPLNADNEDIAYDVYGRWRAVRNHCRWLEYHELRISSLKVSGNSDLPGYPVQDIDKLCVEGNNLS